MVVSTHTNERGSSVCDHTRVAPGGCTATNESGVIAPSSPAEAVPMYRTDGTCANERGPNAHKRIGAVREQGSFPPGVEFRETTNECDVFGPMPKVARLPNIRGSPNDSAIAERERCLRHDYVPSRKRCKPSVMDSGAAMVQRKGDSSPFLIPGHSSHEEAQRLALEINPFERLLGNALSPAEQACVSYNCLNPIRAKRHRRRVIKNLEPLSESLRSSQILLSNSLPELAPARNLHIPLICHLVRELDYADKSLSKDLIRGMPIVGVIPQTPTLPAKETPATMNLHGVKLAARTTNEKVLNSLSKSKVLLLKQKCWDMSREEFKKRWLSEPTHVTESDLDSTILSPRFCISEHHGIQEQKFRPIGDLTKSNVNKTVRMSETYFPHGLDSFVALTRPHRVNGAEDLKQWDVDFPHAYKTIAPQPSSAEADRICFSNPVDNRP